MAKRRLTANQTAITLTWVELWQLREILLDHQRDGCYWGNQNQHYNRTNRMLSVIDKAVDAEPQPRSRKAKP